MLQYPLPRPLRAKLAALFYALLTTPGIEGGGMRRMGRR